MATIITKNSSTAGAVPIAGDLVQGEIAVNVTDKKLYTKNASGSVVQITPTVNDNGFKNRIINGAMMIDQRNAGAAITGVGNGAYTLDRWRALQSTDGVATVQQVSDAPSGFSNSWKWTTTTADSSLAAGQYAACDQKIEGFNTADLAFGTASAATITISFWVKSSLTGTFGGAIANSAFNRSYPFTYTINSANTWEQKSVTIAGDTTGTWVGATNGNGMFVQFGLGVGSTYSGTAGSWSANGYITATGAVSVIGTLNATWQITGVQLEKGSTATSFDYRPFGTELALCQRYYQQISGLAGDYVTVGTGGLVASSTVVNRCPFPMVVSMRSAPTMSLVGGILYDLGVLAAVTTISGPHSTPNSYSADLSASGGGLTSARAATFMLGQSTSNYAALSAEL